MAIDNPWRNISASFSDANSAMGNAIRGTSEAGTVFGKLRQSILDEEQREWDRQYKEAQQNEAIRQFNLNYSLNQDKFGLDKDRFGLDKDKFDYSKERDKVADQHWQADFNEKKRHNLKTEANDDGTRIANQIFDAEYNRLETLTKQRKAIEDGIKANTHTLADLDAFDKANPMDKHLLTQEGRFAHSLEAARKASGGYTPETKFYDNQIKNIQDRNAAIQAANIAAAKEKEKEINAFNKDPIGSLKDLFVDVPDEDTETKTAVTRLVSSLMQDNGFDLGTAKGIVREAMLNGSRRSFINPARAFQRYDIEDLSNNAVSLARERQKLMGK